MDLGTTSVTAQVMLWAFTLPLLLFCFHELEPLLYFRPVVAVVEGSGVAPIRFFTRYRMETRYQSDIFYRYTVAGTPYMGSRYRRTESGSSLGTAYQRALGLVKGMQVRAFYLKRDKQNMAQSILVEARIFSPDIGGHGSVTPEAERPARIGVPQGPGTDSSFSP